jgi:hypothetical protein
VGVEIQRENSSRNVWWVAKNKQGTLNPVFFLKMTLMDIHLKSDNLRTCLTAFCKIGQRRADPNFGLKMS